MKKALKILIIVIIIFITGTIYISYIDTNNEDYLNNLTTNIKNHLNLNDEITYTNQYGNYYIIKTTNDIIVLTKDYKEVFKEKVSALKENPNNYDLIYNTNKLMYEKTIIKGNNLTYEYYDIKTGSLIKKTSMEKK